MTFNFTDYCVVVDCVFVSLLSLYMTAYLDYNLFTPNDVPSLSKTSTSKLNKDVDFITKLFSLFVKYFLYDIEFFLNTVWNSYSV